MSSQHILAHPNLLTRTSGATLVLQLDGISARDARAGVVVALRRAAETRAGGTRVALPKLSAVVL